MHIDLFEYGHWLGPVAGMLKGRVPYRDIFPIHGFLADGGLDFAIFHFSGVSFATSIWTRQVIGTLFQPAIFLVTVASTRRLVLSAALVPVGLSLAGGLVFDRAVIPLIGLAMFLYALDTTPRRWIAGGAGILAVLGILYSLDFGTFVAAAEIFFLVALFLFSRGQAPHPFPLNSYVAGLGVALLLLGGVLASVGALAAFLDVSYIKLPIVIGRVWGLTFPSPSRIAASWAMGRELVVPGTSPIGPIYALRLYAVPLSVAAAIIVIVRSPPPSDRAAMWRGIVLIAANAMFFRYVYGRFHYEAGNVLAIPSLVATVLVWRRRTTAKRSAVTPPLESVTVVAVALILGLPPLAHLLKSAGSFPDRISICPDCVRLDVPRGGKPKVLVGEAQALMKVCAEIRRLAPDGPILDLSNRPGLYFFLDRVNPTRFYQVPIMEPFQDEVIRDLERDPPALVILSSGTALDTFDGRSNADRIPRVWAYILAVYPRRVSIDGNIFALRR
jgi:hypothetical protein